MLLRLVGGGPAKTTLTLLSPGASTGYTLLYPGLSFGDQTWTHEFSGARGTQGQRSAAGVVGNRTVTLPIRIAGTSKDDMNAKLAALERLVGEEIRRWGGLCAWQSNNQTPRQWFRVLTATTSIPSWDNRAEVINRALIVVTLVCAPPVEGDPLDLQDLFTPASAITDYTFDIGSGASMDTSAGRINFGNTSQVQFWHNLSGYAVSDVEVTMHYQVGAAAAVPGVFVRRTVGSPLTGIVAQIDASGTNLGLYKVTAGTLAAQTGIGITTLVTAKDYWLRLRTEGQVAFAEHWTSQPTPQGSPAQSVSWTIAPADQA
ncbi:MAG TPA: hypothetical protein VLK56_03630, partial [Solirubrobacterales bacterium]|nr:hypothetical protein [Solirubrobacterales bacterium]